MSRRRPEGRSEGNEPEQLILLPAASAPKAKTRAIPAPEQAARVYIARRARPSVVLGT